jgi:hypothetical protein
VNHPVTRTTAKVGTWLAVGNPVSKGIINNVVKPPAKGLYTLGKWTAKAGVGLTKGTYRVGTYVATSAGQAWRQNWKDSTQFRRVEELHIRKELGLKPWQKIPDGYPRWQPSVEADLIHVPEKALPDRAQILRDAKSEKELLSLLKANGDKELIDLYESCKKFRVSFLLARRCLRKGPS